MVGERCILLREREGQHCKLCNELETMSRKYHIVHASHPTPTRARGRHTMAIIPRRTISRSCHVCALYGRPSSLMKSFGASCIAQR